MLKAIGIFFGVIFCVMVALVFQVGDFFDSFKK